MRLQIARQAIAEIAARFPNLRMVETTNDWVDLSITLPVQPGLRQEVGLGLQNGDELHFAVSNFWLEWVPCTDPGRVHAYIEAVCGYLAGQYRVLEHHRGKKCVKAELQVPYMKNWKTIGTWSRFSLPLPCSKSVSEVRNA